LIGGNPVNTNVAAMTEQLIFDGRLHSPYSIFLRQPHDYSDEDLLTLFGLGAYQLSNNPTHHGRRAILADADGWTLLSDDWYYTLWHMKTTRDVIRKLARSHDIFACTEGDCDRSFDYLYFRNGKLIREYVVHSPGFSDRNVHADHGPQIPGEDDLLVRDGDNIGIDVASLLGIKTRFCDDDLRVYASPRDD
jgi:hypothetical protein